MTVNVSGMPHSTDFDFFVIQQPAAPFGMSWYQGDIETTSTGTGTGKFIGRFSIETFVVAPGAVAGAETARHAWTPSSNPATGRCTCSTWVCGSTAPRDAAAADCPNVTTPFNGTHNAGPQLLNTHTLRQPQRTAQPHPLTGSSTESAARRSARSRHAAAAQKSRRRWVGRRCP